MKTKGAGRIRPAPSGGRVATNSSRAKRSDRRFGDRGRRFRSGIHAEPATPPRGVRSGWPVGRGKTDCPATVSWSFRNDLAKLNEHLSHYLYRPFVPVVSMRAEGGNHKTGANRSDN